MRQEKTTKDSCLVALLSHKRETYQVKLSKDQENAVFNFICSLHGEKIDVWDGPIDGVALQRD